MSTLQERLAAAMEGPPSVSAADLARACGVKGASVSEWINGPTKSLRGPNAIKAAKRLGVSVEWLSTGSGPMRSGSTPPQAVASPETRPGYVRFQDMGQGGAGPGVINPDYPEVFREVEIAEWQIRQELGRIPSPQRVKLLTVRGNSMAPRIRHGDVVFVDVEDCQPEDGCLFAVLLQGATLIKLLEFRRDGVHIVSLAAPERPDIVPPNEMESLRIAGRVLGAIQLRKAEEL